MRTGTGPNRPDPDLHRCLQHSYVLNFQGYNGEPCVVQR
jgi:hypothetical protein